MNVIIVISLHFIPLWLYFMNSRWQFHVRVTYDLTTVSPVYSEDYSFHQKSASLLSLQHYSYTDLVFSGVRGLISELKPEQHNLPLWHRNPSTCREQWHTLILYQMFFLILFIICTIPFDKQFRWNTRSERNHIMLHIITYYAICSDVISLEMV